MNMQRLQNTLEHHEGLRLKPYKDSVGKLTIGIGRNLDDVGISKSEALLLLQNDIDVAIHYPFTLPQAVSKDLSPFPIAQKFAKEVVSIPFKPWMTDEEISYMTNKILGVL